MANIMWKNVPKNWVSNEKNARNWVHHCKVDRQMVKNVDIDTSYYQSLQVFMNESFELRKLFVENSNWSLLAENNVARKFYRLFSGK